LTKMVGHTTEDVSKLPQWARRRIERLEGEIAQMKATEAAVAAGDTNMFLLDAARQTPRGLPRDSTVRVSLGKLGELDIGVGHNAPEGAIEIRTSHGRLSVQPVVSNVIYVKVEQR
jgi:hypothetical protein